MTGPLKDPSPEQIPFGKVCDSETDPGTHTPGSVATNLVDLLHRECLRIEGFGSRFTLHAQQLREMEHRLAEGRFHLAVLGQVKRGKSTLINAILGEDILPSSVIPLTAIPTFIHYGEERSLRVRYKDNRPDTVMKGEPSSWMRKQLIGFVSEISNPKNEKGILQVEISHPAPMLRDVVLIDTPGIGSTFRHNTEATLNFLPQCDAAFFIISADPPITDVELEFLKTIRSKIGSVFFILNKVDYLAPDEQETAINFYHDVLVTSAGIEPSVKIFPISAKNGLRAREECNPKLWEESGLLGVIDHLVLFLAREKIWVLQEAIARKALDLFHDILLQLQLEIRSLELPLAELDRRLILFDTKVSEAEQQRIHAHDILAGDRNRVRYLLEARVNEQREPLTLHLQRIAENAMAGAPEMPELAAREAVAAAIPSLFEHELGEMTERIAAQSTVRLSGHQRRATELIESVRKTASELFEIPYHAPEGGQGYEMVRKPSWVSYTWENSFSPVSGEFIEKILPVGMRERRARNRLKGQISQLVTHNFENLRWQTLQNIESSFRKFRTDLDTNLAQTINATHDAIRTARILRSEQSDRISGTITLLQARIQQIDDTIKQLKSMQEVHGEDPLS